MIIPGAPRFPYFTEQQLNLDWLLEKVSLLERSAIGQVDIETLYDDADDAVLAALNRYKDKIPFGASVIHLGRYTDQTQVFILFCRADDQRGHGSILYSTSDNISIWEIELADGVFVSMK
jgi:hypothetical protein